MLRIDEATTISAWKFLLKGRKEQPLVAVKVSDIDTRKRSDVGRQRNKRPTFKARRKKNIIIIIKINK